MVEFDFKTISVVIAAVLTPSVLLVFKDIFEKPAEPADEIFKALADALPPGPNWLRGRRKKVFKSILFLPRILLSCFFFILTAVILVLVIVGPDRILSANQWGSLAEPLTSGEKLLYFVVLVPSVAVYIWKVSVPVWKGKWAIIRATVWLWKKKKKR